ncbi:DUF5597 domain-containing protein [Bifidobacterium pullorum]|uniref:DUF5597 domain-containing protein n=1 Tax=Bifidobacterium pullorum TaxID=78448 RepID=UPI0024ACA066|nr:DUF5597 domain-containing protein [Bifidobacterium pullorum]
MESIPHIEDVNGIPTLFVDGEPFLATAGELQNSSAASLDYMEKNVWPNLEGMHVNSLVVPLYWEQIEPEEGKFNFTLVDGITRQAREHDTKIIGLWFGLWKNAESMYVPGWMKTDTATYFRARKVNGEPLDSISPLCEAAVEKDMNAYTTLMEHIAELDRDQTTFIFMQVENEIGLLGSDRDYSDMANELFAQGIPTDLAEKLGVAAGTPWADEFPGHDGENFMAYHYAKDVERIAAAGMDKHPIPAYTNSWLYQYPWNPGSYPAGGPSTPTHRVWKAMAPSLFTLAPDIYVPTIAKAMNDYSYEGNPLFVPEVRKDAQTASYALYAFTKYNAIGYSPFGIEQLALDPDSIPKPPMSVMIALNIDPSSFDITNSKPYLSRVYELIQGMKPLLLEYRGTDRLHSWVRESETDFGRYLTLKNYDLKVAFSPKAESQPLASGALFELDDDTLLMVGMMCSMNFTAKIGENSKVGIVSYQEGTIADGQFVASRVLNGDEKMSVEFGPMPEARLLKLYKY